MNTVEAVYRAEGFSASCEHAMGLVADLTRFLVRPGADVVLRSVLARCPAESLDELVSELLWAMRFHGVEPFEGSELVGGSVRLGQPSGDQVDFEPDPARGFLCDPAVWSPLAAAFAQAGEARP